MTNNTRADEWTGCYDQGWKNLITPAAFSHPAKFSHGLIKRIYDHALAENMIQPGGVILDPFGGVGLGAIYAATCGLSWIGVELEDKFSTLARQNFIEWSERYWCTCGENGNSYLCSMRESVAKVGMGIEQDEQAQDGAILQSGLPQQISLFGEEAFTGARRGAEGAQALEQGEALESRNAPNLIRESNGRQQGDGEKRQLEGRETDSEGWVHRDTGERGEKIGTPSRSGTEPGTRVEEGRDGAPQKRQQARQSSGKFGSNDNIQAHDYTPSERSGSENQTETVCDMRTNFSERERDCLQSAMQAAADSRILATARRQEEGAACPDCGKLIVPFPVIIQGDSRRLAEVVQGAGLVVGSPPYVQIRPESNGGGVDLKKQWETYRASGGGQSLDAFIATQQKHSHGYGSTPGQLATLPPGIPPTAVISSPSFAGNSGGRGEASRNGIDSALFDRHSGGMKKGTGSDPANLDHLKMGTPPIAIVSSPPYAEQPTRNGKVDETAWGDGRSRTVGPSQRTSEGYGGAPGQLGAMASTGHFVKAGIAVVGSPPFENQVPQQDKSFQAPHDTTGHLKGDYGLTAGQIGATQGETFWEAARLIVEQCALLLPPGGAAIWVTKRYIKAGKIVDFSQQWAQLCEACGFEIVHWHRAMLVKRRGSQATMEAGYDTSASTVNLLGETKESAGAALADKSLDVERYSFFRRMHVKRNPHLAIEYEDVICTRKK